MIELFCLTYRLDPIRYYHSGSEWTQAQTPSLKPCYHIDLQLPLFSTFKIKGLGVYLSIEQFDEYIRDNHIDARDWHD